METYIEAFAQHGITAVYAGNTQDTDEPLLALSTRTHTAIVVGDGIVSMLDALTGHDSPAWFHYRGNEHALAMVRALDLVA
jgi:hypothetical protein